MNDLTEILRKLPPEKLDHWDGAADAAIDEIESVNKIRLPEDLRVALRFSNGFSLRSPKTSMHVYNADELAWTSSEPQFKEGLPGMLILGTDGEGSVYYADVNNQIGRGPSAVYLVRMSDMDIPGSMPVGASFTDAVQTIAADTDIYERPELGTSKT